MKYIFLTLALLFSILIGALQMSGAFFSSTASSKDNIISSGSIDVVLGDNDEGQQVTVSNSWMGSALLPGAQLPETFVRVRNKGASNAHHLDITFSYTGSQELAKKIIFNNIGNGFRFGTGPQDNTSINLLTTLFGSSDVDYRIVQGATGSPFSASTVDGADGTVKDSKISLSELATIGKIRFETGEEIGGIAAGTEATLWLNTKLDENLTVQNESVNATISFTLDQDASQL